MLTAHGVCDNEPERPPLPLPLPLVSEVMTRWGMAGQAHGEERVCRVGAALGVRGGGGTCVEEMDTAAGLLGNKL